MPVSKRLRYEVFRRDGFTCRYCGAKAPDVLLTIDHVIPEALGGSSRDPANLVTACQDCNSGKSSSVPDAPTVADVADDALRWTRAMRQAQALMQTEMADRRKTYAQIDGWWHEWVYGDQGRFFPRPDDWESSVDGFLEGGLPLDVLRWCIGKAMGSQASAANKWKYMCGIAWRKVTELQAMARRTATGEDADRDAEESMGGDEYDIRMDERRHMACEILGDLSEVEREHYLNWAREHLEADDPAVEETAVFRMSRDLPRESHALYKALGHLLRGVDGGADHIERARAKLAAEYGENFTETSTLLLAANLAVNAQPVRIGALV